VFKKKPKEKELKRKSVEELIAEASNKLDEVLDKTDEIIEGAEGEIKKPQPSKNSAPVDVEKSLPDPIKSLARETIESTIPALPEDAIISQEFDTLDEISASHDLNKILNEEPSEDSNEEDLPPLPSGKEAAQLDMSNVIEEDSSPSKTNELIQAIEVNEDEGVEDFEELDHEELDSEVFETGENKDFAYNEEIQIDDDQDPLANIQNEIDRGNFSDAFESDYRRSLSTKIKVLENILYLVNQKSDFRLMMTEILEIIIQAIPSEAGSIIEIDYRKGDMFFAATKGTSSEKLKSVRIPQNAGIAGFVVESGESYCTNRADDDTIHLDQVSKAAGFHVKNLVCVPIKIQGRIFGVLELINKMGTENYDNEDVSTLNDIMTYVSMVIENKLLLLKLHNTIEVFNQNTDKKKKVA
jgi:hypothetical protein